jgi:DAK2 domain fusion protein YloV
MPATRTGPPQSADGHTLASVFAGGAEALTLQADALNAINVFPVPDGDTGTNMSLTMRAAVDEIARSAGRSLAAVTKAAAHGALMGAKGNSGVILSQIIAGFEDAAATDGLDGRGLARALERGRAAAYRVVSAPKEGTILTAITAAAGAAGDSDGTFDATLGAAVDAAHEAVARTPDLLPVLREAGVVDAGAQGLYVMLDGMLRTLRGETIVASTDRLGAIDPAWLAATERVHGEGARAGFCTEFVIEGAALDSSAIRAHLATLGDSVLVVGDAGVVRVHVHTGRPDDALAYARAAGAVSHEKVDDMEVQFQALAGRERAPSPGEAPPAIGVVAVAAGDGIEALLRSLGATQIVHGGQTMNPSAGDILAAIEAVASARVIVLPNNKNIVLAAEQAALRTSGRARVVPSRSIPQGVAALVAMNGEEPIDDNIQAMTTAIAAVRTGEVTLAARTTRINGIEIRKAQPIALVDGDLIAAEETVAAAVRAAAARMLVASDGAIVTLYAGEGESPESAEAIASGIRAEFGCDVEVVAGGQPHYAYLIGVET